MLQIFRAILLFQPIPIPGDQVAGVPRIPVTTNKVTGFEDHKRQFPWKCEAYWDQRDIQSKPRDRTTLTHHITNIIYSILLNLVKYSLKSESYVRPVVAQERKCDFIRDSLWVRFPFEVLKHLIFSFLCSGVEAKCKFEFRHSTCFQNSVENGEWSVLIRDRH